jgi:hypothetical protein
MRTLQTVGRTLKKGERFIKPDKIYYYCKLEERSKVVASLRIFWQLNLLLRLYLGICNFFVKFGEKRDCFIWLILVLDFWQFGSQMNVSSVIYNKKYNLQTYRKSSHIENILI